MTTLYHCAGCDQLTTDPKIMINIDMSTLNKVSFEEDGRKTIKNIPMVGQFMLCGPKCASLLMLDIFTRKENTEEEE